MFLKFFLPVTITAVTPSDSFKFLSVLSPVCVCTNQHERKAAAIVAETELLLSKTHQNASSLRSLPTAHKATDQVRLSTIAASQRSLCCLRRVEAVSRRSSPSARRTLALLPTKCQCLLLAGLGNSLHLHLKQHQDALCCHCQPLPKPLPTLKIFK